VGTSLCVGTSFFYQDPLGDITGKQVSSRMHCVEADVTVAMVIFNWRLFLFFSFLDKTIIYIKFFFRTFCDLDFFIWELQKSVEWIGG